MNLYQPIWSWWGLLIPILIGEKLSWFINAYVLKDFTGTHIEFYKEKAQIFQQFYIADVH